MEFLKKISETDSNKLLELSKIEQEFDIFIPDEYKYFYSNYEIISIINTHGNICLCYRGKKISNYYSDKLIIGEFCGDFWIRKWFEIFQDLDFFNEKAIPITIGPGNTFIILVSDRASTNFGKVLFYDLEMATDEVFVLADSFNEFLSVLKIE